MARPKATYTAWEPARSRGPSRWVVPVQKYDSSSLTHRTGSIAAVRTARAAVRKIGV